MRKTRPPLVAVAAILDHITPKIILCAILNPLKQPEAKTIGISTSLIFSEIQDGRRRPFWIRSSPKRTGFGPLGYR